MSQLHFATKIKSMIWSNEVLIFNDHQHVKYLLVNGEKGTIKSIDQILYLVDEKEEKLVFLNTQEEFEEVEIDQAEI